MFGLDTFQFNCHLFARRHVRAEVNVAKGAGADLATEAILFTHA